MLILSILTVCMLFMAGVTQSAAATVISFSPHSAGTNGDMLAGDMAGAPGVRVGNWNNFHQNNMTLGDNENILDHQGHAVSGGLIMSIAFGTDGIGVNGNFSNRAGESIHDQQMFNGGGRRVCQCHCHHAKYPL